MGVRNILPLLRLRFTPALLVPQYLGLVLATRELWPSDSAVAWRWLLAALACSPLIGGGATHLLNDAMDLEDDRTNPRRQQSPLVRGLVGRREVLAWAAGLRLLALGMSAWISLRFLLVYLAMTALSIAYSVRPVRLKARAGWDVLAQASAQGLFFPLTGWVLARPLADFPWWLAAHFTSALAVPFLFVLLYDLPADRARGIRTSAVALGSRGTMWAGLALMLAALGLLVAFAALRYVVAPRFLCYALPLLAAQLLFLPRAWRLRDDPPRLKRYIYSTAGWLGLAPYAVWTLYLAGCLPP